MKLARPVFNKDRVVLVGQGTELTPSLISKIAAMGIPSVRVHGATKPPIPRDAAFAAIDERFRNVQGMPYMETLKKLMKEHIEGLYEQRGPESHQEQD